MLRRLTLRHAFRYSQANLQIYFHGVDPQALLHSSQKEDRWPDSTPPLGRDYPAVTVADFAPALSIAGGGAKAVDLREHTMAGFLDTLQPAIKRAAQVKSHASP